MQVDRLLRPAVLAGVFAAVAFLIGITICATPSIAQQNQMLAQKVAQTKQLMAVNRQQLARYTWQMQETVSVSGDVKKADLYQVQLGPDGQQVRTLMAQPVGPQGGGRPHGIKHRMEQKFEDYAQQVGALAKSYSPLDPAKIQQLYSQGLVSLKSAGTPGYSALAISNYLKQGDSIVLVLSGNPQALSSVSVNSYLSQPSDAVTMQVQYAKLPDGTRYTSTVTVNGQSKNLTIVDQSTNFALRPQ